MRLTIIALSILALAGCKTLEQRKTEFAQSTDSFIGKSADDLVIAKGPPSNTFTLSSGGRVFEYAKSRTVTSGGGSYTINQSVYQPNSGGGGTWVSVPVAHTIPVSSSEQSCKLLFKISASNVVESVSHEGNDCY